jgi:hypothetical protein
MADDGWFDRMLKETGDAGKLKYEGKQSKIIRDLVDGIKNVTELNFCPYTTDRLCISGCHLGNVEGKHKILKCQAWDDSYGRCVRLYPMYPIVPPGEWVGMEYKMSGPILPGEQKNE